MLRNLSFKQWSCVYSAIPETQAVHTFQYLSGTSYTKNITKCSNIVHSVFCC